MIFLAVHQVAVVSHRLPGQLFEVDFAELGPQVELLLVCLRGILGEVVLEPVETGLNLSGKDAIDWKLLEENRLTISRRDG